MPVEVARYICIFAALLLLLGIWYGASINRIVGKAASWLALVLVLITVYDVVLRNGFQSGSVAIQELEWHVFALLFLLGAGYTLAEDSHVRVDILYGKLGCRGKAAVNALGTVLFLLPFCALLFWTSLSFLWRAYEFSEGSDQPGGLPYRFLIKSALPLGVLFVAMQGMYMLRVSLQTLFGRVSGEGES